ncbi:MAG: GlxA family transcriptional regulator [Mucilaginibacter sp.]|uniref:GlxA family transcriptional regulator n=1 Tax=Mucilaginibacter sp. TaxID=1882438 RepID=UPI0031AEF442
MEKRLIVIVAMPDALSLDITGTTDVFSFAKQMINQQGNDYLHHGYEVVVASATYDLNVTTNSGLVIFCKTSIFNITEKIDTLLIGGSSTAHIELPELVSWMKLNAPKIRRIGSICLGAFLLAQCGFLKNRRATTHWMFCKELSSLYEHIRVDPDPIFIKDDNIYTSAGATAGIDLALALVEEDHGRKISLKIAQMLVLYLRRPGNQSQYSNILSQQFASKKQIRDLQQWITDNLKKNLDVQNLAEKALMSPRNFARVFVAETGMTPAKYIQQLRIECSKRLLEETNFSLDQIAQECGFGSTDTMRNIFVRNMQTTPHDYRSLFGTALQTVHKRQSGFSAMTVS